MSLLRTARHVVHRPGDTLATIAAAHGLEPPAFANLNDRAVDAVINPGETLNLPNDTVYTVQAGDTVGAIAAAHGLQASLVIDELGLDNASAETVVPVSVVLSLPKIDAFKVEGQSIDDIVQSLSGEATAEDFGEVNGIPANAILYIGQTLALPEDVWGSAAPDAVNPGTACLQHAVSGFGVPGNRSHRSAPPT